MTRPVPAVPVLVPAGAVAELLAAIHAALPEATGHGPVTGADMVRVLTDGVLRRGLDEAAIVGATTMLREGIPVVTS